MFEGSAEEQCARAAKIYQCGKEKAPNMTSALENAIGNKQPLNAVISS